ncbi:MAG: hypothetical protein MI975_27855 [Cytophagales bacterium]|nr:hypothetical protein [Cytophagales bacterium]
MKRLKLLLSVIIVAGFMFLASCDNSNDPDPLPLKTGVLIVNEGNFGAGNGSISFYDEELQTITNNVVKTANGGSEIGSLVQSMFLYDEVGYILCNDADKIEFISEADYKYLDNPTTNISQPRYMTAVGNKGYISCWGAWGENYTLPDSYVAVIDLTSREVVDTLECGSGPEGIIVLNNKLYVANSYETTVSVINLADNSSEKVNFDAAPKHFAPGADGNLWVSISAGWSYPADKSGVQSINLTTGEKGNFVPIQNTAGSIVSDVSGEKIYILAAELYPKTGTKIYVYNTITKNLLTDALISGDNFYGLGYNVTTDKIYVSDSKAFAGPGDIHVYDTDGTKSDDQITGVGPNGFAFK